jgi:hypothetical protein
MTADATDRVATLAPARRRRLYPRPWLVGLVHLALLGPDVMRVRSACRDQQIRSAGLPIPLAFSALCPPTSPIAARFTGAAPIRSISVDDGTPAARNECRAAGRPLCICRHGRLRAAGGTATCVPVRLRGKGGQAKGTGTLCRVGRGKAREFSGSIAASQAAEVPQHREARRTIAGRGPGADGG